MPRKTILDYRPYKYVKGANDLTKWNDENFYKGYSKKELLEALRFFWNRDSDARKWLEKAFRDLRAEIGEKVIEGGREANRKTYGTAEEKTAERERYLQDCLSVAEKNPKYNLGRIRREVARMHKKSEKTILRHTPNLSELLKSKRN